jgi:hypothetical protein
MFEQKGADHSDFLYIINSNNEIETNQAFNPYIGEINLMRVNTK